MNVQNLSIEQVDVADLTANPRNAKVHPAEQVLQLQASIEEFGWTMPLLADEGGVLIAGHGRLMAAKALGFETVPVITARGWSEEQKRAYMIADNKLTENGEWDADLLRVELADLDRLGVDLALTGFSGEELAGLLDARPVGYTDPNYAPPLPENPVTVEGDVWRLGRHRLLCGDATKAENVKRLYAGAQPHLMVTDPPYGVKYDAAWRVRSGSARRDGTAVGRVLNDDRADWREAWALFGGDVAYIWHAGSHSGAVSVSLEACKFKIRAQIIWVKQRPVFGRGDYHFQHEPAFYAVSDGAEEHWHFVPEHEVASYTVAKNGTGHYDGGRKQSTVWNIEHFKSETGHSTQKPIDCMKRPIENNSKSGDAVYDPFCGSGTTLIAAEMTGRVCYALELSPAYCDVIVKRWEEFTGEKAERE